MSQFFISCKESKIENNRSFYGCFNLGPFEPSQSITIANALRRTLLSELYGLSIISVEIEGATHEYSNLSGVKDSVLDILLNLKEIVLKKSINPLSLRKRWNFGSIGHEQGALYSPQIGYLKARGPGVVRASNMRLPPFLQCVDPDQYIATLAEDGFLNMRFIIQYGNKWAAMLGPRDSGLFSSSLVWRSQTNQAKSSPDVEGLFKKGAKPFPEQSLDRGKGFPAEVLFPLERLKGTPKDLPLQKLESLSHGGFQDFAGGAVSTASLFKNKGSDLLKDITENEEKLNVYDQNSTFNLHLKKRRLILKKLRHIGLKFSNSYINFLTSLQLKKKSGFAYTDLKK